MEAFEEYLTKIENPEYRARLKEILGWIMKKYPNLVPKVAWNQPMFTDHGTCIIGFSVSKQHMAVAPEGAAIDKFPNEIAQAGYDCTKGLMRIRWDKPVDFSLLEKMIEFNIMDKADDTTFWRK